MVPAPASGSSARRAQPPAAAAEQISASSFAAVMARGSILGHRPARRESILSGQRCIAGVDNSGHRPRWSPRGPAGTVRPMSEGTPAGRARRIGVFVVSGIILLAAGRFIALRSPRLAEISVSQQTTYLTTPTRADGWVDYPEAVDWMRRAALGVDGANAAAPLVHALGSGLLPTGVDKAKLLQQLGVRDAPADAPTLARLSDSESVEGTNAPEATPEADDWLRARCAGARAQSMSRGRIAELDREVGSAARGRHQRVAGGEPVRARSARTERCRRGLRAREPNPARQRVGGAEMSGRAPAPSRRCRGQLGRPGGDVEAGASRRAFGEPGRVRARGSVLGRGDERDRGSRPPPAPPSRNCSPPFGRRSTRCRVSRRRRRR